jgi:hypothetical protein
MQFRTSLEVIPHRGFLWNYRVEGERVFAEAPFAGMGVIRRVHTDSSGSRSGHTCRNQTGFGQCACVIRESIIDPIQQTVKPELLPSYSQFFAGRTKNPRCFSKAAKSWSVKVNVAVSTGNAGLKHGG